MYYTELLERENQYNIKLWHDKQAPVGTGMSRARNLRWGMLLHMNEAGIYGG